MNAQFCAPWGLPVDSSGNLYISDAGYGVVRKVNTSGIISTVAGNGVYGFSGDGGPATAAAGSKRAKSGRSPSFGSWSRYNVQPEAST